VKFANPSARLREDIESEGQLWITWYSRAAVDSDPSASTRLKNLAHLMTQNQLDRANAILAQSSPSHPSPDKPIVGDSE
jgi:hypothetical protein